MTEAMWFIAVAIGPLLLVVLFAYALLRRRRLSAAERAAQIRATERVYDEGAGEPGRPDAASRH
jgi:hypothetical protein